MNYIYGPVPSRRLGLSLGVSPIPKKTCNYSCIYCQLGRTTHMTNERKIYFPVSDIIQEFLSIEESHINYDVVTIVGEGEPTLYKDLKKLIIELKKQTNKPIAVITNGSLLHDKNVRDALYYADIVLPSIDAYDEKSFKKINRPHPSLSYQYVYEGLRDFSIHYKGQLWLEIMLMKNINDDKASLDAYKKLLKQITYDKLYLNTPVRPPAEKHVQIVNHDVMNEFSMALNGIAIDLLMSSGFKSHISDDYEAIKSIIKRHPMNQYEIKGFLLARESQKEEELFKKLEDDIKVEIIEYQKYKTYRLK